MVNKKFSETNIKRAGIRHEPQGWGISVNYGIVARACSWDDKVEVGDNVLEFDDFAKQLKALSKRTGRDYSVVHFLCSEDCSVDHDLPEKERLNAVCIVGVVVPSLMYYRDQSHDGLVKGKKLQEIVANSQLIVNELKSLGFKDITTDDLYLHANAYDH